MCGLRIPHPNGRGRLKPRSRHSRAGGNDGRVGHTWSCRSDSRIRHFSAAPSCRAGVGYKYPTYGSTAAGSLGCKPNIGGLCGRWVSTQATLLKNKFSGGLLSYRSTVGRASARRTRCCPLFAGLTARPTLLPFPSAPNDRRTRNRVRGLRHTPCINDKRQRPSENLFFRRPFYCDCGGAVQSWSFSSRRPRRCCSLA